MKKKLLPLLLLPVIGSITVLGSCSNIEDDKKQPTNNKGDKTESDLVLNYNDKEYKDDFSITVSKGSTIDQLRPGTETNPVFTSSDANICAVDSANGLLTPKTVGNCTITASTDKESIAVSVTVQDTKLATGISSYANVSMEERIKIMAALEDYAVENYLTGITMFSNGGYVCYSDRYTPVPKNYVAGYGWGTMREGKLTRELKKPTVSGHGWYYNIGTSSIPELANAMDASGSDVSDLAGYLTQAYFTTRLNATADGYEWVPGLADNEKNKQTDNDGVTKSRPWAIDDQGNKVENPDLSKRWRIYVKTGDDAPTYALNGTDNLSSTIKNKYNGRKIQLEDYLTPFKFMLTNYNGQYRGSELTDGTSGFEGAASYFAATTTKPSNSKTWYDETAWNKYMSNCIYTGTDSNGSYIEFNLLYECTQFYAMYYLSSSLYSPLPGEFIEDFGTHIGTNFTKAKATEEGRENLFATSNDLNMVDTTLSCGPYVLQSYTANTLLSMNRNPYYNEKSHRIDTLSDGGTREIYQIEGFDMVKVSSTNSLVAEAFLAGEIDSYAPDKTALSKDGKFNVDDGELSDGVTGHTWHRYQTKADATFKLNVNATTQEQWIKFFGKNGTVYPHASDSEYSNYTKFYLSDKHFLNFLSFAMDRQTICESRGMTPTQEYLSDNYLIDPENSISYNDTDAHKAVLADRYNDTYGYNETAAKNELITAMEETIVPNAKKLTASSQSGIAGTKSNPYLISLTMSWMNETDTTTYGDVFDSITKIANEVMDEMYGGSYKFVVNQVNGTSDYNAVYNKMKQGEFELGFGAISGGDLNPLNFLEVLKSDNSSGFTLNWGPDTSVVDSENPIVYDGKTWSFDALWNAGNSAVALDNQGNIANVKNASTGAGTNTSYPYESKNNSAASVTYKLSFDALIQAGAKVKSVRITNGNYTEEFTDDDLATIASGSHEITKTFGSGFNYSSETSTSADCYMLSVVVNYTAGNANLSSTLRLPTYAGL